MSKSLLTSTEALGSFLLSEPHFLVCKMGAWCPIRKVPKGVPTRGSGVRAVVWGHSGRGSARRRQVCAQRPPHVILWGPQIIPY